jgi:glycosyltransferase involved in cell wall biosynthesis
VRIRHIVLTSAFAGVERHVCVLANAQIRQGHHVEVWGGRPAPMRALLSDRVVHRSARMIAPTMARALGAPAADVLHAHMTKAEGASVLPSVLRSTPLVVTRHFAATRGASQMGRLASAIIRRRVDAQLAISNYVARTVDGTSTVVYPGVEVVETEEEERRPVALVVQRLQPEKSTEVALRVFAAAAPAGWSLDVVGEGPELSSLQDLSENLGIADRTAFLGFRDDVAQLMRSSSVLIAPCEIEGLGLSVLEAMSQGLPVLASDAGAHPETVGRAADPHLFPAGEASRAAAMLSDLCNDVELRERYGAELREVQRTTFTPEAQAEATEAVYRTVLG